MTSLPDDIEDLSQKELARLFRVQAARKRKGLEDYPCKSGGLVEYTYFARAIDSRITTECITCPPDPHPDDYFCAWRFYMV